MPAMNSSPIPCSMTHSCLHKVNAACCSDICMLACMRRNIQVCYNIIPYSWLADNLSLNTYLGALASSMHLQQAGTSWSLTCSSLTRSSNSHPCAHGFLPLTPQHAPWHLTQHTLMTSSCNGTAACWPAGLERATLLMSG